MIVVQEENERLKKAMSTGGPALPGVSGLSPQGNHSSVLPSPSALVTFPATMSA